MSDFYKGLSQTVGKTISGVVVKNRKDGCYTGQLCFQVFLLFSDNTYYEFYNDARFTGCSGVDRGGAEEVRDYIKDVMQVAWETHTKSPQGLGVLWARALDLAKRWKSNRG
jgi:hypothetical protein